MPDIWEQAASLPSTQPTQPPDVWEQAASLPAAPPKGNVWDQAAIAGSVQQFKNTPYVFGGNAGTGGTDCSGMACDIFKRFGIDLPRTAAEQFTNPNAKSIKPDPNYMRPGDAVYFKDTGGRKGITHVAVYLGDGKYGAMSGKKTGYKEGVVGDSLWTKSLAGVKRFLPDAQPTAATYGGNLSQSFPVAPGPLKKAAQPPNPLVPSGMAFAFEQPKLTQEQELRVKYFNNRTDKSEPNKVAVALAKNPQDLKALEQLNRFSSPIVKALTLQKADEYAKEDADIRDTEIYAPPSGPGGLPTMRKKSTGQKYVVETHKPSEALAQVFRGQEGAKILQETPGFLPAVEKFVYSMADPESVGLAIGTGGIATAVPKLLPLISAGFATAQGKAAVDKWNAGDQGGALFDALLAGLAGTHATAGAVKVLKGRKPVVAGASPATKPEANVPVKAPPPAEPIVERNGRKFYLSTDETGKPVVGANGKPVYTTKPPVTNGVGAKAVPAPESGAVPAVLDQQPAKSKPSATAPPPIVSPDVAVPLSPATTTAEKGDAGAAATSSLRPGNTTGIAQRVHDVRAEAGRQGEVVPGQGASPEEMVNRGHDLIKQGVDPVAHIAEMEKRGMHVSADDMAVLRAKHFELGKATDRAFDKFGKDSPEYKAAFNAETAWARRIKPYQTEWSKIGSAQQGETDLDTGSFTSIARHFGKTANRPMTPQEEVKAQAHAEKVQGLETKVSDLQAQLDKQLNAQVVKVVRQGAARTGAAKLPKDPALLREHFAKRVENGTLFGTMKNRQSGAVNLNNKPQFTQEEIRAIWNHAKENYIDNHASYTEMRDGIARDLGLKPEWVDHALAANKTTRVITADMYRAMSERRQAVNQAKAFVENAATPGYVKVARSIGNFPRAIAVFGHGTVGMTTHAGVNMLRPSSWPVYWKNFGKQFPIFFSKNGEAIHEQMMQSIEAHPDYAMKLQAGLKIDPGIVYDDYQQYSQLLGKVGGAIGKVGRKGNLGMDVLKKFRSDYFDLEWNRLPKDMKTPAMAKQLSTWVNHAAGSGDMGHALGPTARAGMFAPSLEASRWARVVGDPAKTVKTYANWKNATPEERAIAKLRTKRAAEVVAVLASTLVANQGALTATGQKDGVNFTDPNKSDWLAYKWNGKTYDPKGGVTAPLRLLARVFEAVKASDFSGVGRIGIQYARGKANPAIGTGVDVALRKDAMGRPLPFASDELKAKAVKAGKTPYTWQEYIQSKGPIPFSGASEAYYEAMHSQGVDHSTAKAIWEGLQAFGAESVGVREGKTPVERTKTVKVRAQGKTEGEKMMNRMMKKSMPKLPRPMGASR